MSDFWLTDTWQWGSCLSGGGGGGGGGQTPQNNMYLFSVCHIGTNSSVMYLLSFHHTQRTHHINKLHTCLLSSRVTSSCWINFSLSAASICVCCSKRCSSLVKESLRSSSTCSCTERERDAQNWNQRKADALFVERGKMAGKIPYSLQTS